MDTTVLVIFGGVYLGMLLGEIPGFALDRTGVGARMPRPDRCSRSPARRQET